MVDWWLKKLAAEDARIDFAELFIEDHAERTTATKDVRQRSPLLVDRATYRRQ